MGKESVQNAQVELYYDNSKKFETTSTGVSVTGEITASSHIKLPDSAELKLGSATNGDFALLHDGTDSILNNATGDLLYRSATHKLQALDATDRLVINSDGHIDIGGNVDFGAGIDVTGDINCNGIIDLEDTSVVKLGTDDDFQLSYDNPNDQALIAMATGKRLKIKCDSLHINNAADSSNILLADDVGAVSLFFGTTARIKTNSTGGEIVGNLAVTGTVDGVDIASRDTLFGGLTSSSGVLSNGVTATTQTQSDNSNKVSTTAYVRAAVANLVNSAPSTLDTLKELSDALGADANFSTTVTNSIATKLPLAGGTLTGNLAISSGGLNVLGNISCNGIIDLEDASSVKLGTNDDFILSYDDSNDQALIAMASGKRLKLKCDQLHINNAADSASILLADDTGAVSLFFGTGKKFETTSTGVSVTGGLTTTGTVNFNSTSDNVNFIGASYNALWNPSSNFFRFNDNAKAVFGTDSDLQIYYDGSNSKIETSTGDLYLKTSGDDVHIRAADNVHIESQDGSEKYALFAKDGAVELYYDGTKQFYTTSDGIESNGEFHFKAPSSSTGEQVGRLEWWNENDAGVMAKIAVDRTASSAAPADLVFFTSANVDTTANGGDGDITERVRIKSDGTVDITGNITATGEATISGQQLTVQGTSPRVRLIDTDQNSDFQVSVDGGNFIIEDITNSGADRFVIDSNGSTTISGGISTNSKDVHTGGGTLIASDSGGAFSDRSGGNIDHLWFQETNTEANRGWNFCEDTTYKAVGNAQINVGRIRANNQPAVLCTNINNETYTDADNDDPIRFATVDTNNGGCTISSDRSRITVPIAGVYMLMVCISGTVSAESQGDGIQVKFRKNGNAAHPRTDALPYESFGSENGMEWSFTANIVTNLAAGDYIECSLGNIGTSVTASIERGYLGVVMMH